MFSRFVLVLTIFLLNPINVLEGAQTQKKLKNRALLVKFNHINVSFSGITVKKESRCDLINVKKSLKGISCNILFARPLYEAMVNNMIWYLMIAT